MLNISQGGEEVEEVVEAAEECDVWSLHWVPQVPKNPKLDYLCQFIDTHCDLLQVMFFDGIVVKRRSLTSDDGNNILCVVR